MAEKRRMTEEEIQEKLLQLSDWELVDGKLHRELKFANFVDAFAFMTKLAILAEKLDHHPEWSNVYNRVILDLQTHEVGGISELDFDLAAAADALL